MNLNTNPTHRHNIQHWALALLLLNLTVFVAVLLAQKNGYSHPALGYVKAFAEAACVGALADWFAVVALFRHPLGVPLPHTAILPAKQAQLAQGVAKFIGTHFLDPEVISTQLARLQVGERLNQYAQKELSNEAIGKRLPSVLQALVRQIPLEAPDKWVGWSQNAAVQYLSGERLGRSGARLVALAQEQHLDRKLVNHLAASLHEFVTREDAKERARPWLAEMVNAAQKIDASWWDKVKSQFTGQALEWADDWLLDKALTGLADLSLKIQADDNHPAHIWVAEHIDNWRGELQRNDDWHLWLATHVHDWLRTPNAQTWMQKIWQKSRAWLDDAAQADSALIEPLSIKIRDVVLLYMSDAQQQAKMTRKVSVVAANLLTEYQSDIREWLTTQMNAWSKERLTTALEGAIGRDLQYIRINGTLIGGLIGVLLYVFSQLLK